MTPADVLRAAKARIADPTKWCQGHGRDGDRRCAFMAVCEVESASGKALDLLEAAALSLGTPESLRHAATIYNDSHTHAEVMHLFDVAIGMAEAGQ